MQPGFRIISERPARAVPLFAFLVAGAAWSADPPAAAQARVLAATSESPAQLDAANARAWPFVRPPLATLRASPHKVFAHYFTPFPISVDNKPPEADYYSQQWLAPDGEHGKWAATGGRLKERPLPRAVRPGADWEAQDMVDEVRRASALGLDGFALDILSTSGPNWRRDQLLLSAAAATDPGFKIVLMPDMEAELKASPEKLVPALLELAKSPAAYRLPDGRLVVAPYNAQRQSPDWWADVLASMKTAGVPVALFPVFQGWPQFVNSYAGVSYGVSDWGTRSPGSNRGWVDATRLLHKDSKLWMAPVSPQDFRPKSQVYWEARNSENYRTMWAKAIDGGADWVQIVTWNDYSEGSEISPSTGIQWSYYDLSAYYVSWFKTGSPPPIVKDVLYYFHRRQATNAGHDGHDGADGPARPKAYALTRGSDPASDDVELLAFLTKPGTLQISVGGKTTERAAPAGMSSFKAPIAAGTPTFRLLRGGKVVVSVDSAFPISDRVGYPDMLYRGGSSAREPVAPQ